MLSPGATDPTQNDTILVPASYVPVGLSYISYGSGIAMSTNRFVAVVDELFDSFTHSVTACPA